VRAKGHSEQGLSEWAVLNRGADAWEHFA